MRGVIVFHPGKNGRNQVFSPLLYRINLKETKHMVITCRVFQGAVGVLRGEGSMLAPLFLPPSPRSSMIIRHSFISTLTKTAFITLSSHEKITWTRQTHRGEGWRGAWAVPGHRQPCCQPQQHCPSHRRVQHGGLQPCAQVLNEVRVF